MGTGTGLVEVDGRYGEGGGSILRLATALSAVTGQPLTVRNIRENRPRPGLAPQHLTGLKALARLFSAHTQGIELGSTWIKFVPRSPDLGRLSVDVGTAGSVGLMLQSLMIALPFTGRMTEVTLTGGTHVRWAPNLDYLENITLPILGEMGYECNLTMLSPGYYPKGGGRVSFISNPCDGLRALRMDSFGEVQNVEGVSRASNLPEHVARRQAKSAADALSGFTEPRIGISTEKALCPGSAITLWASTTTGCRLGASALGERGKPAEAVGREAGEEMRSYLEGRAPIDSYMLDQVLPYAALARGTSVLRGFRLTTHATTNIYVIGRFLDCQIDVEGETGEPCVVKVRGVATEGGIGNDKDLYNNGK